MGFFGNRHEVEVDIINLGCGALKGFQRIFGTGGCANIYAKCRELQTYPNLFYG
jgi:hypothetical protein